MTYSVGQIVKTVYGAQQVIKINKSSVIIENGLKINVRQLDIMNK